MPDVILEKRDDGVAILTLNRPESLNAMGGDLMPLLAGHLAACSSDPAVRCVVLTGAGRAFCAGGDVKEMATGRSVVSGGDAGGSASSRFARGVASLRKAQRDTSFVLHTMPKPTIAMINGVAVGAGLSLALACDLRIASDRARLGTVFRNVGFSGDFGGSYFLPLLVGAAKARELYLTGELLDAAAAERIGMVNRVVPHDRLTDEALALAEDLANGPTLAFARMKENLNLTEHSDLLTALDHEALNMSLCAQSDDHREAAAAFVAKRKPIFKGA